MADNRKYYYMKLKEDFFESDAMIALESVPEGYLYSNILLKLYLRSLRDDGRLLINGRIPYNATMIASFTRHQIGTVEKALQLFEQLGIIEVLDNGAIYMADIQNFIGESSTEADRKRDYRRRIEADKRGEVALTGQMSGQTGLENRDKSIEINNNIFIPPTIEQVREYCNSKGYPIEDIDPIDFVSYYGSCDWMVGKKKMTNWHSAVAGWANRSKKKRKGKSTGVKTQSIAEQNAAENSQDSTRRELEARYMETVYLPAMNGEIELIEFDEWERMING